VSLADLPAWHEAPFLFYGDFNPWSDKGPALVAEFARRLDLMQAG